MHIILVSDRLATARSITLTWRHAVLFAGAIFTSVLLLSSLFSYITVRHAAEVRLPFLQSLLMSVREQETQKTQDFLRENLNAMAVRLGQMQAQLLRLDTLGERLGQLSGIKTQEVKTIDKPGQGAPLIAPTKPLTPDDLKSALPASIAGLDRGNWETGGGAAMGVSITSAKADYGQGDRRVRLEITDPGGLGACAGGLAIALRELARRRAVVELALVGDRPAGTIDRVGADHLDLAVHALEQPRRPAAVAAIRLVPLAAIDHLRWRG